MYSQLSGNQLQALTNQECPHCHSKGNVRKIWTRNGPAVKCDSCQKRIYKPRGRAIAHGGGGLVDAMPSNPDVDVEHQSGEQSNGNENGETQGGEQQSQTGQKAEQAVGKPLTQAAKDAISKIENVVRQEAKQEIDKLKQQLQQQQAAMREALAQQVEEQVESLRPTEVIVKQVDQQGQETQVNTVPQAHSMLAEILERISMGIVNLLFVGPSGTGKSTLARQIAEALGVPYSVTPWSGGTTEGMVIGRPTLDGLGFTPSTWVKAYSTPSVHNMDEIDGADPNVPICCNSGIENGAIYLPTGPVYRHARHIIVATANTWGIGADMLYCGRNQIDAAFKSRFAGGLFFIDYSAELETQLVPEKDYRQAFWQIRQQIFEHKLRRIWGTRELIRGALILRAGKSMAYVFKALTVGYSADELSKIGIA